MTEMLQIVPFDEVTAPAEVNSAYVYEHHQTPTDELPITAEDRERVLQALPPAIGATIARRIEVQAQPGYQPEAKYEDGPYEEGLTLGELSTKTRQRIGMQILGAFTALLEKKAED
jgi:hypothetical protein